jgi:hypothetical protein
MDPDAFRLVTDKLPVHDVAKISLVMCDQTMIRERKEKEFEKKFAEKMRYLWYGRLSVLHKMHTQTAFWHREYPNPWACNHRFRDECMHVFRGWYGDVCGGKLHLSTRILDEVISLTVDFHAPFHSLMVGDPICFKFDVVQTSRPLDIDAYAPSGTFMSVLDAVYKALRLQTEQLGTLTTHGVVWQKCVTREDMAVVFGETLGSSWTHHYVDGRNDYYCKTHDGVAARARFMQGVQLSYNNQTSFISIGPYASYIYTGPEPATAYGPRGSLTRKLVEVMIPFDGYSMLLPVRMRSQFSIKIRIHDAEHVFVSWHELSAISGISVPKLRTMSVPMHHGVFINFDKHTYRRKPITFKV